MRLELVHKGEETFSMTLKLRAWVAGKSIHDALAMYLVLNKIDLGPASESI